MNCGGAFEEALENKSWLSLGGLLHMRNVSHKPSCKKEEVFICAADFLNEEDRETAKPFSFLPLLDSQGRSKVCFERIWHQLGDAREVGCMKQALASYWGCQMRRKNQKTMTYYSLSIFWTVCLGRNHQTSKAK